MRIYLLSECSLLVDKVKFVHELDYERIKLSLEDREHVFAEKMGFLGN